ncbi:hypothetical protein ACHAPT_001385 [Fusarium lateritium]
MAASYESGPSLLDLPPELRTKIYRLLLRQDSVITGYLSVRLHTAILRTCRQIMSEAPPILYAGNTWAIKIMDKCGDERAYFPGSDHIGKFPARPQIQDTRRLSITVEIQDEEEIWNVRSAIRKVCHVLSDIPRLDYVHLSLEGGGGTEAPEYCHVLKNFGLLRGVGKVTTTGVPCVYAEYLRRRMTGSATLGHLPKMYEVLELYAGPFDFTGPLLQDAIEAMELGDAKQFKALRAQIVEQVDSHMKELADQLYDHDGQHEADYGLDYPPTPELLPDENVGDLGDDSSDDLRDEEEGRERNKVLSHSSSCGSLWVDKQLYLIILYLGMIMMVTWTL